MLSRKTLHTLALGAILIVGCLPGPVHATAAGDNGGLVVNQNGFLELTDPDTSANTVLQAPNATSVGEFSVAPNGDTVAFRYSYDDNFDGTFDRTVLKFISISNPQWGFEMSVEGGYHYSFSPDSSAITYASYDDQTEDYALHILDLTDGSAVELRKGMNTHPEWSPYGDEIAYNLNNNIYLMNLSTGSISQLTSDGQGGLITDWSPDGETLAIIRNNSLYFLDSSSGIMTKFDQPDLYANINSAAFSPDGTRLAFTDWNWGNNSKLYVTEGFTASDPTHEVSVTDLRSGVEWQTLNGASTNLPSYPMTDRYPIYRFYSPVVKHHLFTSDSNEASYINNSMRGVWHGEGVSFYVNQASSCEAGRSVYRFYSELLKTHLFTMDEYEKSQIITKYPSNVWRYEGVAYCANNTQVSLGQSPVYRFYSELLKTHLYTIDENEKAQIIANYPSNIWKYEGVAYYAYPNN